MFGALRFAIGISSNVYANGVVLIVELVGSNWRVLAANSINYMYVLGELVVLTLGYFFRDYRIFYIALTVLSTVFISYFWLVPESPRFLILKGKRKQAYAILARIARSNNREFSEETFNLLVPESAYNQQTDKVCSN